MTRGETGYLSYTTIKKAPSLIIRSFSILLYVLILNAPISLLNYYKEYNKISVDINKLKNFHMLQLSFLPITVLGTLTGGRSVRHHPWNYPPYTSSRFFCVTISPWNEMDMCMHYSLSRANTTIHTNIKSIDTRIIFQYFSS